MLGDRAEHTSGPALLALTRQNLATLRTSAHRRKSVAPRAPMNSRRADGKAEVTLLATGSEVEIAMEARESCRASGTPTRVVSMPCWELFEAQPEDYREEVLGPGTVRVAVEAAVPHGLGALYRRRAARFVGMHGFGASAPYKDLYKHFGITAEAVAEAAMAALAAAK